MKNLLGKGFALLLLSAATLTSCKKDKDGGDPNAITKENVIGTYMLVEIKEKTGTDEEMTTTDGWVEECQLDDKITLNTNMTYTYSDAGTQCDPNGNKSGSWEFNETAKTFKIEDLEIEGVIEKVSATELVIKQVFDEGGFYYSMRWFFVKK